MKDRNEREADRGRGRGRGQRVRLGDIAADLGLSTATVSLALRDSPLVAEDTRARIKAHAEARGYIYNRYAASLRTARTDMIGVAVHDIQNPYFAEIFRALEDELGQEKQVVLICNHRDDVTRQRQFVDALLQHRVDGIVLCPSVGTQAEEIVRLTRSGVPVTLICREIEGVPAPLVRGDDHAGGYAATKHLIENGHRRIAMVGGRRQTSVGRDRNRGWREALSDAGIDPASQIDIPELMTRDEGFEIVPQLLNADPAPTAVVAFNDLIALGLLDGLRRAGRTLAITGYDDINAAAKQAPSLTSVNNSATRIGRIAADLILKQIAGDATGNERILIEPELMIRESSA
ncbi:LacI family DNA-binding transcriptional regulator [Rhizobiales bacterium]|uniref:LacI family DNA-binding transcriptional regulator n=1 Tax=Hongsoonwoonella zoysiae TaxID=2821844 RepID=UPI001561A04B|nr:LacI family DNA-binding transcriptional regulator [Hongsoonwoonella zoysiae]NRG17252.1 LacI family DNA-binding transcriptional regulator [Hongsoonwoonella zoysiae]